MNPDDKWIEKHFEELVEKYAGKYVAVSNQELVAIGDNPKEVEDKARGKYPHIIPSVLLVPTPETFDSLL